MSGSLNHFNEQKLRNSNGLTAFCSTLIVAPFVGSIVYVFCTALTFGFGENTPLFVAALEVLLNIFFCAVIGLIPGIILAIIVGTYVFWRSRLPFWLPVVVVGLPLLLTYMYWRMNYFHIIPEEVMFAMRLLMDDKRFLTFSLVYFLAAISAWYFGNKFMLKRK